jgi:hypothetical protein
MANSEWRADAAIGLVNKPGHSNGSSHIPLHATSRDNYRAVAVDGSVLSYHSQQIQTERGAEGFWHQPRTRGPPSNQVLFMRRYKIGTTPQAHDTRPPKDPKDSRF